MKVLSPALALALALSPLAVQAGGDPVAGESKSATCAACHGQAGVSTIPDNPILAGQYASYLEHAIKAYRDGARRNPIMSGMAAGLSDQDIADLAAYYAAQDPQMVVVSD